MALRESPHDESAASAGISRTTAYRYFPSQRALLLAAHPEIEQKTLLPPDPPEDVPARLDIVLTELARINLDWEPELRTALRLAPGRHCRPASHHPGFCCER